jgi:hypothetical protein
MVALRGLPSKEIVIKSPTVNSILSSEICHRVPLESAEASAQIIVHLGVARL